MSHFTVLVIGDNPEEQLRPFQENNMGDCPPEFMEFNDLEDEYKEEYENKTLECIFDPDGKNLGSKYSDSNNQFWKREAEYGFSSKDELDLPEGYELRETPFKECYATLEEFADDWHGASGRDETTGRYGYYENPNAKWDWYQLGGRWTGFFKVKIGAEGRQGDPGLMTPDARHGWADQIYKRDVDFEGMAEDAIRQANEKYNAFEEAIKDVEPFRTPWNEFREQFDNIDDARKAYWQIPFIKATKDLCLMSDPVEKFKILEDNPRQAYVNEARASAFATFAVIVDGKWYERGEMGWWGIVSDEKDKDEWLSQLYGLIVNAPEDTLFSVFDCHI